MVTPSLDNLAICSQLVGGAGSLKCAPQSIQSSWGETGRKHRRRLDDTSVQARESVAQRLQRARSHAPIPDHTSEDANRLPVTRRRVRTCLKTRH